MSDIALFEETSFTLRRLQARSTLGYDMVVERLEAAVQTLDPNRDPDGATDATAIRTRIEALAEPTGFVLIAKIDHSLLRHLGRPGRSVQYAIGNRSSPRTSRRAYWLEPSMPRSASRSSLPRERTARRSSSTTPPTSWAPLAMTKWPRSAASFPGGSNRSSSACYRQRSCSLIAPASSGRAFLQKPRALLSRPRFAATVRAR